MTTQKKLSAVITIGGALSGTFGRTISKSKSGLAEIGSTVRRLTNEQQTLGRAIQSLGRDGLHVDGLRTKYVGVTRELERQRVVMGQVTRLQAQQNALAQKRADLGASMRNTMVAGAAAALPIGASVMRGAKFGYESQLIGNTANMDAQQIAAMNAGIMSAAKETSQAAGDVQRGLGFLVAAGLNIGDAQTQIRTLGKTATATAAEIEDVAKTNFVLIDTLKVPLGQTQRAIDSLLSTSKDGNVEFRDMARVVPVLGASFAALGMYGRTAAASMGAALQVARKGAATGDEAATNLQNFLTKIQAPETLKKAAKEWGVDLSQTVADAVKAGGNPLDAVLQVVAAKTGGNQKKLGEVFGDMQVQAFLRPALQNLEEYRRIRDRALSADGVVDKDFASMRATDLKQIHAIGEAFDRVSIRVGMALARTFGGDHGLAARLDAIGEWIEKNGQLVGSVAKVGAGLVALKLVVGTVGMAWATMQSLVVGARLALVGVTAASTMAGTAAGTAGTMARAGAAGFATLGVAAKAAGVAMAGAFAAYEVFKLGSALVDLHGAKNREGVKLSADAQRRLAVGELAPKPIGGVALGSGMAALAAPAVAPLSLRAPGRDGAPAPRLPALPEPVMATSRGTVTSTSTVDVGGITIVQQPGQDARALAREVGAELERQRGVKARSSMYDGPSR